MLNVSITLYYPDWDEVFSLVDELVKAKCLRKIYLVDNSPTAAEKDLRGYHNKVKYLYNGGENLGYGRAHNVAIRESVYYRTKYHLVVNSDIIVRAEDIDWMHAFMDRNEQVGSMMPHVVYPNGETQYLCKLLPTPWNVFGRRFLPQWMMRRSNERYELRASGYDKVMNVPYLSGCFMFLRTEAVLKARLFDERFFMYPEDIDLTRRIHRDYLTLYVPDVTIVHNHARTSYRNARMLWVHVVNMCRYFNKWGWVYDPERRLMNRLTLEQVRDLSK